MIRVLRHAFKVHNLHKVHKYYTLLKKAAQHSQNEDTVVTAPVDTTHNVTKKIPKEH